MILSVAQFTLESMVIANVNDPLSLLSDQANHGKFMDLKTLALEDVTGFARAIDAKADYVKSEQHTAALTTVLLNACVGVGAVAAREKASGRREDRDWIAYLAYRSFMELQPFVVAPMNGIVGRAIWLWCMGGKIERPFLVTFHDQALRFGGVAEVEKGTTNVQR